jgi:hypothetical protein
MNAFRSMRVLALVALLAPTVVHAAEPPIELLFIPPIALAVVATIVLWRVFGTFSTGTTRAFLRMLLLVVLWTPVPSAVPLLPSAIAWWYVGNGDEREALRLVTAIAISAILGAIVIVLRSAWRLYTSPR